MRLLQHEDEDEVSDANKHAVSAPRTARSCRTCPEQLYMRAGSDDTHAVKWLQ